MDFDGTSYVAYYDTFKIMSEEEGFKMILDGYNATRSTLADGLSAGGHHEAKFSTSDMDNDDVEGFNCAGNFTGGNHNNIITFCGATQHSISAA